MRAVPSHQKRDITIRRALLLALGLLVAVLYAPERRLPSGALKDATSCIALKAGPNRAKVITAGIKSAVNQTKALSDFLSREGSISEGSISWEARLAAFKSEERFDYKKVTDYLFGQVVKGITGISWAEYETSELLPPLVLQSFLACPKRPAQELKVTLLQRAKTSSEPAAAEQAQLAFSMENGRGEYIMLPGAE